MRRGWGCRGCRGGDTWTWFARLVVFVEPQANATIGTELVPLTAMGRPVSMASAYTSATNLNIASTSSGRVSNHSVPNA